MNMLRLGTYGNMLYPYSGFSLSGGGRAAHISGRVVRDRSEPSLIPANASGYGGPLSNPNHLQALLISNPTLHCLCVCLILAEHPRGDSRAFTMAAPCMVTGRLCHPFWGRRVTLGARLGQKALPLGCFRAVCKDVRDASSSISPPLPSQFQSATCPVPLAVPAFWGHWDLVQAAAFLPGRILSFLTFFRPFFPRLQYPSAQPQLLSSGSLLVGFPPWMANSHPWTPFPGRGDLGSSLVCPLPRVLPAWLNILALRARSIPCSAQLSLLEITQRN